MAVFQGLLNCYSIKCERESEREHAVGRQKKKKQGEKRKMKRKEGRQCWKTAPAALTGMPSLEVRATKHPSSKGQPHVFPTLGPQGSERCTCVWGKRSPGQAVVRCSAQLPAHFPSVPIKHPSPSPFLLSCSFLTH